MAASTPVSSGLIPELAELRRQFEFIDQEAISLTEGLTEAQFNWRPDAGSWSICECLGHLLITGEAMCRGVDAALENPANAGRKGHPPFRYPVIQRWIVKASQPEASLRLRAPRRFHAAGGQPITAVLPTFRNLQQKFILRIEQANGLDLAAIKVLTPVTRIYRFSLGMIFAQVAAHSRRHLAQARRVRQHAHFPK